VIDLDAPNLTVTAQAGIPLETLRRGLGGLFLHVAGGGTLGGVLSTRGSPGLRNEVLGLKAVLSDGRLVSFGAKVMKNVAGYDALKLFLGAWGTLGVIVEATLRLHPRPAEEAAGPAPPPPVFAALSTAAIHRRIKTVFDPKGILNPSLFPL
jgi:D-lactate dehydrogenase (cytochrome)